jgi:uncharacterized protein (TIGR03086 family)
MESVADRYRRLSSHLTDLVAGVPDDAWSGPTPCEDWTVRELVSHVVEVHGIFQGLVGRSAVDHPPVESDPLGAWTAVRDQMQADLDDPVRVAQEYDGMLGRSTFGASVDGFVCFDLVVHGWDLARATGQDESMDPADVSRLQAMVDSMAPMMLENGVIGRQLEPAPDASPQQRLLASLGRRA